jgi:large subunit ribosomal protein L6
MDKEKKIEEIEIPSSINAELNTNKLTLTKGNKKVIKEFKAEGITMAKKDNKISVSAENSRKKTIAKVNAIIAHINNMVVGLEKGYIYRMKVIYSHFPMNIQKKDKTIEINNFIGSKKARIAKIMGDATVEIKGKDITVSGCDKEAVGQTAANLEAASRAKNRDLRVFHDGIFLHKKELGIGK